MAVVEPTDAEPAESAVAPAQLRLKLSFYDIATISDVPANGST